MLDFAVRFVVHDGDVEEADVAGMRGDFDGGVWGRGTDSQKRGENLNWSVSCAAYVIPLLMAKCWFKYTQ